MTSLDLSLYAIFDPDVTPGIEMAHALRAAAAGGVRLRRLVKQRTIFAAIEPDDARRFCKQLLGKSATIRRAINKDRVKDPGLASFTRCVDRNTHRLAPLTVESPEIDQKRIGARDKGTNLFRRHRHRGNSADGKQDVGRELGRNDICQTMDTRLSPSQMTKRFTQIGY